jgi:transposase
MAVRVAAPLFRVSISYIYKALIRRRETGETEASSRRGHRPRRLTPAQEAALAAHIHTHPAITLVALRRWLADEHGVQLSSGALWLAVDRLGLTVKKNAARRRAGSAGRGQAAPDLAGGPALHRS